MEVDDLRTEVGDDEAMEAMMKELERSKSPEERQPQSAMHPLGGRGVVSLTRTFIFEREGKNHAHPARLLPSRSRSASSACPAAGSPPSSSAWAKGSTT